MMEQCHEELDPQVVPSFLVFFRYFDWLAEWVVLQVFELGKLRKDNLLHALAYYTEYSFKVCFVTTRRGRVWEALDSQLDLVKK